MFKAQVAAGHLFEQNFKRFQTADMADKWLQDMKQVDPQAVIQNQLQFLRVSAALKLVIEASGSGDQLGIDVAQMTTLGSQSDDQEEFKALTSFLKLDTAFSTMLQMPTSLKAILDNEDLQV